MAIPFSAFLPLIGQGVNAISNLFTNKAQKNTNLEMYDRQRTDALSDWNRQNQYNSPSAQMQRFKEAGLSPHLIYGQTNTAPPVRSSDAKPPSYVAPQFDAQSANPLLMALQMDNMKKQGALLDSQAIKNNSETNWKNVNTNLLKDTFDYKVGQESWKANLFKAQHDKALMDTERSATDIKKTEGEIKLQKYQAQKMIADTNLSIANKAKALQTISNLLTTQNLLRKKYVTEDFIQEAYAAKTTTELTKNSKLKSDMYIAQDIAELKKLGLSMDIIKNVLMPITSKNYY